MIRSRTSNWLCPSCFMVCWGQLELCPPQADQVLFVLDVLEVLCKLVRFIYVGQVLLMMDLLFKDSIKAVSNGFPSLQDLFENLEDINLSRPWCPRPALRRQWLGHSGRGPDIPGQLHGDSGWEVWSGWPRGRKRAPLLFFSSLSLSLSLQVL